MGSGPQAGGLTLQGFTHPSVAWAEWPRAPSQIRSSGVQGAGQQTRQQEA